MTIITLDPTRRTGSTFNPVVTASPAASNDISGAPRTVPAFIRADEAYYWSVPWQESEQQALADIAAGRVQSFADPADAVRYLLSNPE